MIIYSDGSIFNATATTIVNPVNCVGVMGGGLALQFKHRYPENYKGYKQRCASGNLRIGMLHTTVEKGKRIIDLPTKIHWKDPSKLEYVKSGLQALRCCIRRLAIKSVAIPALGCGLGGLDWPIVEQEIIKAFKDLPEVKVTLYPPK